ncbi:MAG: hypothetical protein AAFQ63_01885 [Cyanobacteria bacterium J06621_11]
MLAYTTVSDLFELPSVLEAVVYLGGLLFVLACPYLFLWLMDLLRHRTPENQTATDTQTQQ